MSESATLDLSSNVVRGSGSGLLEDQSRLIAADCKPNSSFNCNRLDDNSRTFLIVRISILKDKLVRIKAFMLVKLQKDWMKAIRLISDTSAWRIRNHTHLHEKTVSE